MKFWLGLLFVVSVFSHVQAVTVMKVKGKKVLLDLQGAQVKVGQKLAAVDNNNQAVAILKVVTINKGKALANLVRGNVTEKNKVIASNVSALKKSNQSPVKPEVKNAMELAAENPIVKEEKRIKALEPIQPDVPPSPYFGSVLLGLASNTLSLKVGDGITSQNVDNTGNSVGIGLAVDRQYFQPWFRARALLAYEQFNAIGAATINGCANQTSKDCTTDIKYISTGGYAKYVKEFAQFLFWGAAGLNLKVPIQKSSTALVESSLGVTAAYGLGLGVDYTLETKKFITASVEKQFYVKSDSAETATIFVRLGVGKEF